MQLAIGEIYEGKVTGITKFGAFVTFEDGQTGMVHISEIAPTFVNEIKDFISEGQEVKVKVLNIGEGNKISLSIKKAMPAPDRQNRNRDNFDRSNQGRGVRSPRPNRTRPPVAESPARPGNYEWQSKPMDTSGDFEDMLSKFKQSSDEKMSDLKRGNEGRRGYSRRGTQKG